MVVRHEALGLAAEIKWIRGDASVLRVTAEETTRAVSTAFARDLTARPTLSCSAELKRSCLP